MKDVLNKINKAHEVESLKVNLAKHDVKLLNQMQQIEKDYKIGSDLKILADSKMRQCEQLAKEAQKIYKDAIVELKDIDQQVQFIKKQITDIGLQLPSGVGALDVSVKKAISDITKMEPNVKRTISLF